MGEAVKRVTVDAGIASIGLEVIEAMKLLDDNKTRNNVLVQEQQRKQAGISGMPTIVFNLESAISGYI